jgi:tRNA(Ile2) C34 agmatinyltransferase TiaS
MNLERAEELTDRGAQVDQAREMAKTIGEADAVCSLCGARATSMRSSAGGPQFRCATCASAPTVTAARARLAASLAR